MDSGTLVQEIQPDGEVSPCLFANVDLLPPPLTPPTQGGESRAVTINFLPLDGGGEVGVKGHHTAVTTKSSIDLIFDQPAVKPSALQDFFP
jgi:hypothetical protein